MAITLFDDGHHKCIAFDSLVKGEGIQSNQFLVIDGHEQALIDPGGYLTYTPLTLEISRHMKVRDLTYVFASHQDPDIIASLDRWLMYTDCKVVCSELWARFLPHLVPSYQNTPLSQRIIALPDEGGRIPLGNSELVAVPAHFLHSVGNFQFYDPVSRILFSGDVGASDVDRPAAQVLDFDEHVRHMAGFHRRYMGSNRACRLWANMVRDLAPAMIVPQHGSPFVGPEMIERFLDWISSIECGIDLLTQNDFRLSRKLATKARGAA